MRPDEVLAKINEVLRETTDSPVEEMRKLSKALAGIADALDGRSLEEQRNIIRAVSVLHGYER